MTRGTWALPWLGLTIAAVGLNRTVNANAGPVASFALIWVAWGSFALGAWCVLRLPRHQAAVLILGGAVALQIAAGLGGPRTSDDLYRYVWDGRVQAAGIDPYRYPPAAPELVDLRDEYLWPADAPWCVTPGAVAESGRPLVAGCTRINRPGVNTIYPPVAQALFAAVHGLSPPASGATPIKVAAGVLAVATAALLLVGLGRIGADPRRAALWAWCPAVAIEAGANAHVDVAAAGLTAAALLVLATARGRHRAAWGGVLLGLAIATKVTPVLVVPAILRRRWITVLVAAVGAVGLVYLPHVLAVGGSVLGYLPGYLHEEGYGSGDRFALLTWFMPSTVAAAVAALILFTVAAVTAGRGDANAPWRAAALVAGSALLLTCPAYTWYSLLLVVLVALGARAEWLAVAALGYVVQYSAYVGLSAAFAQRLAYGLALAVVVIGWQLRRRGTWPTLRTATGPTTP